MSSPPDILNDAFGRSGPAAAYHWLTGLWLMLIGVSGSILLWLGLATAVTRQPAPTDTLMARDDADAILVRFGVPDDDHTAGEDAADPAAGVRVMTYRTRRLRVTFVRRRFGSPPQPVWKLVGFTEPDGTRAVAGEEALRRLNTRR